jgi:O-antigen/teichoic acid export membrane protein
VPDEPFDSSRFFRKILGFSVWFAFIPITQLIFRYTDRWMLNFFLGPEKVGIYAVGANITWILFMIGTTSSRVLVPNLSALWERGERQRVYDSLNLALKATALGLMLLSAPVILLRSQLIQLLVGAEYLESAVVIPLLCVFYILNPLGWVLGTFNLLIEKPRWNFTFSVLSMGLNLALNYLLILRMGMIGAALATTISYAIGFSFLTWTTVRNGLKIGGRTVRTLPLVLLLLLPPVLLVAAILALLVLSWKTPFLLSDAEKRALTEKAAGLFTRFRRPS